MKITKIIIPEYRQFKNFELDLTYPEGHAKAGQPLEKVCFIGTNGTGKSTLLRLLDSAYDSIFSQRVVTGDSKSKIYLILLHESKQYFTTVSINGEGEFIGLASIQEPVEEITDMKNLPINLSFFPKLFKKHQSLKNLKKALIYSPADSYFNYAFVIKDIPESNVNEALKLQKQANYHHIVSNEYIQNFWTQLIISIKERDNEWWNFLELPENQDKTQRELKEIFDPTHPKILEELAKLWDSILNKCGLYFDYKSAKNPIQLLDNLQVYIKTKSQNEVIGYSELSTGIRNFIFRLGHIFSLYFNREVESGFLLVDEPENSLFPDFKRDLIEIYLDIIKGKNTQFFVATHDPIIAAQFEPCERVILDFDENGFVTTESCHKGIVPIGDDPNDMLIKDFQISSILGTEGVKMWEEYINLQKEIPLEMDLEKKKGMLKRFMQIGTLYNFAKR